ncbi:MAG TPA: alpha/beta hydrolase [Terracidiphilus sp.]|nr:alpha/beta hydrolase [Terracidiphilus sp.]
MNSQRFTLRFSLPILMLFALLTMGDAARCQTSAATANPSPSAPTRFSVVVEGPAAGKAPDVVLIPGLASSREVYAAEAKLLAPEYRLHLIQLAGFAGEPAGPNATGPIFEPVVEQLHQYIVDNHLEHPPVIGHSMGGLLALMLADAHPGDVGKLLIVDTLPFYGLVFNPNATVEALRPQAQAMHDGLIAMPAEQFAASQPSFSARLVASPEGQKAVTAGTIASDRTVFANAMLEDLGTDLRPRLAGIKTPATVLYPYLAAQGTQSEVAALYTSSYAGMPNVQFVRIDGSLHFIMYDQPAVFHAVVVNFLGPARH